MKKIISIMLLTFLIMLLLPGIGCKPKSISEEQMNYFNSLKGKRYWVQQPLNLVLEDENGKEVYPLNVKKTDGELYIDFYDTKVISKNENNQPTTAIITLSVSGNKFIIKVNRKNEKALKGALSKMETNDARNKRLYKAAFDKAKDFLAKEDYQSCIKEVNEAKKYLVTDELKAVSDTAHFKLGNAYYEEKKYTSAMTELRQVQFDKNMKKKAEILLKEIKQKVEAKLGRIRNTMYIEYDKSTGSTNYFPKLMFHNDQGVMGTNASLSDISSGKGELIWGNIGFLPSMSISKDGKRTCYITLILTITNWIFANQVVAKINNEEYSTSKCNESDAKRIIDNAGNFVEVARFPLNDPKNSKFAYTIANTPLGEKIQLQIKGEKEYTFLVSDMTEAVHQEWKDMMFFWDNGGD